MNFYEALRFCFEESLPIKRKDNNLIYGFFEERPGIVVFVDEWRNTPNFADGLLEAEWEEADVREKVY
jgi:hypothetical protein